MSFRSTLLTLSAVFLATNFAATHTANAQRLPTNVRPEHYSLILTPDLLAASFRGEETIDVSLETPSKTITLNAAEITFGEVKAYVLPVTAYSYGKLESQPVALTALEADKHPQIAQVTLDATKQQATFTFPNELPAGKVTLAIRYTGILNNKLR